MPHILSRTCVLGLGALFVLMAPAAAQDAPAFEAEELFPLTADHAHGATIAELPSGELLAAWFQGSGERQSDDVAVLGARLAPGADAWSAPFVMADVPDFPDINPVLFLDEEERLWLMWYTVLANQWETSLPKYRISTDYAGEGAPRWDWQDVLHFKPGGPTERGIQPDDPFVTSVAEQFARYEERLRAEGAFDQAGMEQRWREHADDVLANARGEDMQARGRRYGPDGFKEQDLGYPQFRRLGWQTRNKPHFIDEGPYAGRMIVPFYSDGFSFSLMAITDDGGQTWQFSAPLAGAGNIQPALAQRDDGTLVAYMRDNGPPPKRLHVATSDDGGMTWSDVEDTDLANSGAAADVLELANGHWVIVWNDTEEGRHQLAVALSEDEGRTWSHKRYIERDDRGAPGGPGDATRSHYPAVIQGADGRIHVIYSYHHEDRDGPRKTIKHAAFNEAWVRGG